MIIKIILTFSLLLTSVYAQKGMSKFTYEAIQKSMEFSEKDKFKEAKKILDEQILATSEEKTYDLAFLYNSLAYLSIETSDYEKAIELYKKAISYNVLPEDMESNTVFSIAQLSIQIEKYKQSILYLEKYHSKNSISGLSSKIMMMNYIALKKPKSALEWANKSIKLSKKPELSLYQNKLALEQQLNLNKSAVKTLQNIIKLFEADVTYFKQLSYLYQKIGDEKKAAAILESAYQMDLLQEYSDKMLLAQLLHYQGATIKAIDILKRNKQSDLKEQERLEFLYKLQLSSQEKDDALKTLKELYKLNKSNDVALLISKLYADLAEWSRCEEYSKKVVGDEGKILLAISLAEQKKFSKSSKVFETLLDNKKYSLQAKAWIESISYQK
jgi:tetratricopeptide (TPR) repeat protein